MVGDCFVLVGVCFVFGFFLGGWFDFCCCCVLIFFFFFLRFDTFGYIKETKKI